MPPRSHASTKRALDKPRSARRKGAPHSPIRKPVFSNDPRLRLRVRARTALDKGWYFNADSTRELIKSESDQRRKADDLFQAIQKLRLTSVYLARNLRSSVITSFLLALEPSRCRFAEFRSNVRKS